MVIFNGLIPVDGFKAINLFGAIFVKHGAEFNDVDLNHEEIHTAQMKEMLYLPFYLVYIIEWFIRLFTNKGNAYRSISFEQEAYDNQGNPDYLKQRKRYAWFNYIKQVN